jgi:hypothetical protein
MANPPDPIQRPVEGSIYMECGGLTPLWMAEA